MARYSIKRPGGGVLYEGCPTYVGQYMKPGTLTYRNVASPEPIDFAILDYTDYEKVRWGPLGVITRFLLLTLPPVKKLARRDTNGNSFVYDQVVLYDATKLFDFIPFRDIVPEDNSIHFSSKESFSVYDNVPAIAERIQACLDAVYPGAFNIMVATSNMGAPQTLLDLMNEDREISFATGGTVMDALQKIYEVWPEVGWVSFQLNLSKTTVVIGGAGLIGGTHTFRYGEGLTDIANNVANDNEIANIIYPFGNSKNLLPRYYNSLPIHNAESADIQHLMIPTSYWGQTDGEPDPLKAGVMDNASIGKIGRRPKIVYFNGQNDLEDIYPSIKGITVGDINQYITQGYTVDYPPGISVSRNARIDQVVSVAASGDLSNPGTFDNGRTGEDGRSNIKSEYGVITKFENVTFPSGEEESTIALGSRDISDSYEGKVYVQLNANINVLSFGPITGYGKAFLRIRVLKNPNGEEVKTQDFEMSLSYVSGQQYPSFSLSGDISVEATMNKLASDSPTFEASIYLIRQYVGEFTCPLSSAIAMNIDLQKDVSKSFAMKLEPIGFNIKDLIAVDGTPQIQMTSGPCAGRTFTIKDCSLYSDTTNRWRLSLERSLDDSLGQYFPNSDYVINAGDSFVILGIGLPELYIVHASNRLYTAAQEYLAQHKSPMWQYTPSIDAKYMVENGLTIIPAQNFVIVDPEMIPDGVDARSFFIDSDGLYFLTSDGEKILLAGSGFSLSILVDSVTINEGESNIPTWKVSLRDRKKKRS